MNRGNLETAGAVLARLRERITKAPADGGSFVHTACKDARSHDMQPAPGGIFRCQRCGWWYRP